MCILRRTIKNSIIRSWKTQKREITCAGHFKCSGREADSVLPVVRHAYPVSITKCSCSPWKWGCWPDISAFLSFKFILICTTYCTCSIQRLHARFMYIAHDQYRNCLLGSWYCTYSIHRPHARFMHIAHAQYWSCMLGSCTLHMLNTENVCYVHAHCTCSMQRLHTRFMHIAPA
jgi:hypothetical protein